MILDSFGPDAGPLLVAGSLGGLVRGLIVLRSVMAKGGVTRQVIVNTSFDTGTSIVIGACISLFLHDWVQTLIDPLLNITTADIGARALTSGFVGGFGCIALAGLLWDFFSGLKKPSPPAAPPQPPVINQIGQP